MSDPLPLPLVSASWLAANLSSVRPVDLRWYLDGRSGQAAYEAGHIPGAVRLDIDRDLSSPRAPDRPGRHPLPSPEAFAEALARVGIGAGEILVAHDDEGGAYAARLWWLARYFDAPLDVRLLDGGLQAWEAHGGALEPGVFVPPAPPRPMPPLRPSPAMVVDRQQVQEASSGRRKAVLLDARALPRYRGDLEPIDPRPGHIPGARSAPFVENLREPKGYFMTPVALRQRYEALGVGEGEVIVYCGSGVTACHDLLALRLAGYEGLLYEGSWSDWSSDPTREARLGEDP
jgi:thiosulfate/3-mercaptopyruvate sulfurtransferase